MYTPILISPLVLRSYNCGQVDLAYLSGQKASNLVAFCVEVKSSRWISPSQQVRIKSTRKLLSAILNLSVGFKLVSGKPPGCDPKGGPNSVEGFKSGQVPI
ncbi:MAG: hypothetical protein HOE90_17370 [Bacteriovoracaceae bacterium]|nr:hypothetical protein [Bacteriovoracaceae bacterium]